MLDKVALLASGAVNEKISAFISDCNRPACFLSWHYDLSIVVQVTAATGEPALSLISGLLHNEDCLSFVCWSCQSAVTSLLPFAKWVCVHINLWFVVIDVFLYKSGVTGTDRGVQLMKFY